MKQKSLEALDDILDSLYSIVDDHHFGQAEEKKFTMRDAWDFVRGDFNFHDDDFIYEGLKQINRATPNKIKNLAEALDKRGDLESLSDFRQSSLGYKVFTAPLWLPKKAANWALNKFSNEGARQAAHYVTLAAETVGLSYLATMVEPGLVPAVAAWSVTSEVGDKVLDYQVASQLIGSLWPLQLNHKQHELLSTCSAKRIEFGKLIKVADEFVDDYKNQRIRSNNFGELLEINPEMGEFLESVHQEGHRYKYLAAATAGFISTYDLPDEGENIVDAVLSFFNTKRSIREPTEREKQMGFRHVYPIDGDHMVGALLRRVQQDLISAAENGGEIPLEFEKEGLDALAHYTPTFKMKLVTEEDSETPQQYLEGTVTIPLSELKGQVSIRGLTSRLESSISQYIQGGNLIPDPTLGDCPEVVERSGLDLSEISGIKINVNEFIGVSNSATIDNEEIVISYRVVPNLHYTERVFDNEAMNIECGRNPMEALGGGSFSVGYRTINRWALPEKDEHSERWQKEREERFASGRIGLYDVKEHVVGKARDAFEAQVKSLYDKKTAELETAVEENASADTLFQLGVHKLIESREEGTAYINRAIEAGLLEQDKQAGLLSQLAGKSTVKNRNPLYMMNEQLKRGF